MFSALSFKLIPKLIFDIIKLIVLLFSMIVVCLDGVLLCKNQLFLKEILESFLFWAFLTVRAFAGLISFSQVSLFFYILVFLEIVYLFNILIIILFKRIKSVSNLSDNYFSAVY